MKSISILILFLFSILLQSSYAQSLENELTITLSADGEAKITETLNTPTTISSINVQLISNKTSNLLTIDEKNIFLNNLQNGNQLRIDSLGASHVTLSYNADIVKNDLGIWRVNYNSNLQSTVILPPLSNIVSVNKIPIDINDNALTMPPGEISISYTIRTITAKNFMATVDGTNYSVEIMTGSQVSNFKPSSDSIMLTVDDDAPILVIVPKLLLAGPYEVLLNGNPLDFKQYYQNSTHSWIRIEPTEDGSIMIIDTSKISDQVSQQPQVSTQPQGGCLIATATYGSELAPQVQFLREIRDNTVMSTSSGAAFMTGFNQLYYSFSPTIADMERENPMFQELVRAFITPMISTLSIMTLAEEGDDTQVLVLGIFVIALNLGMYIAAPMIVIHRIRKYIQIPTGESN